MANQSPTATITRPLNRLTGCPLILKGVSDSGLSFVTAADADTSRPTNTTAAMPKPLIVVSGLMVNDCVVSPTSNGPVQPNPARRYPNP